MNRWLWCATAAMCVLLIGAPAARADAGVTAEDYFAFETLGDPHFSPDGSTIAFVVTTVDQKQNRRRSAIWVGACRRLARAACVDDRAAVVEQPAVESGRQGDRVSLGAAGGGRCGRRHAAHARCGCCRSAAASRGAITNLLNGVSSFQWSPDGTQAGRRRAAAARATRRSRRATCATTRTPTTSSTTAAGSTTSARICGSSTSRPAASTQITSGDDWNDTRSAVVARRPARSRSSPTAPARRSTRATTPTSG